MKYLSAIVCLALCVASCSENKSAEAKDAAEAADSIAKETVTQVVDGKWRLTDYVANDSTVKVPADKDYVLSFAQADSTFSMTTSCNNIGGKYVVSGDTIKFSDTFATRMMCEDMSVEDAMNSILNQAETVKVAGDSVMTLSTNGKVVASFAR